MVLISSEAIFSGYKGFTPLHNHGTMFKVERYFAVAMVPLIPAAYFIHGREMDLVLTLAIALHVHWGAWGVVNVSCEHNFPYSVAPFKNFIQQVHA